MTRVHIGLGANLGGLQQALSAARQALREHPAMEERGASSLYRSAPLGPAPQPDYLNAVLCLHTNLEPERLLDVLQVLEADAGRERGERWGPRSLDLDLLLYGDRRIDTARLTVPHPEIYRRNFVLLPLAELCAPGWRFPDGSRIEDRCAACPANPIERLATDWHTAASQCSATRAID